MPEAFFAILIHNPFEAAWFSSSHASHAPREANGKIGSSDFAVKVSPLDLPSLHNPTPQVYALTADSQVGTGAPTSPTSLSHP